jgi:hypothetical protein
MAIKIKKEDNSSKIVFRYQPVIKEIHNLPWGTPMGSPVHSHVAFIPVSFPTAPPVEMPEAKLPRALNYYADYGGCGYWRMIWPEYLLNGYQKACISGLTCMVLDPRFYQNLKSIRLQRQATPAQRDFIKELRKIANSFNFRMIYEVDDIVFKNDIPDYNRCKDPFCDQAIEDSILDIMRTVDEITVTCDFMKEYYKEKTGHQKVTVIPNYAPKFWLDKYYDEKRIERLYEKNKKRPRILYSGSGTHIDTLNKTGLNDDFKHVVDAIIKARKKFKFVWKGCFPLLLKPYIDNGEMEFIQWSTLFEYPKGLYDTECNAVFASLQDNIFNKSKSNIKMVESGALGMPGAFQNLCTYKDAEYKFTTGDELINQLETITSDYDTYMDLSRKSRKFAEGLWLEDHINEYEALYFTDWGSKERKNMAPLIAKNNPEQDIS